MPIFRLSRRGAGATVSIGGMNCLISIETRLNNNAYGQPGGAWSAYASGVWAKIDHVGGREIVNQTEYAAEITDRFTIPYVSGVTPKMRVNYPDIDGKVRYFDILFVQNIDQRGMLMILLAKEIYSNT